MTKDESSTTDSEETTSSIPFENFVTVLGWGEFSESITDQLLASSNHVAVITDQEDDRVDIREEYPTDHVHVTVMHFADFEKMKALGVGRSRSVFLNLASDEEDLITILRMKRHFPDLDYMVALSDEELEQTFRSAGVTYAVSKYNISSKILASYLYEPDVAEYTEDLLKATEEQGDYDIQQYRVTESCRAIGDGFVDLMHTLRNDHNCVPIGLRKADGTLHKVPEPDTVVNQNDFVLLITQKSSESGIEDYFGTQEGVLNGHSD
jgi:voltage-gated potassium channel